MASEHDDRLASQEFSEGAEKVYYQYDHYPYPDLPIDQSPQDAYLLACSNLTTPYYLRNRRIADLGSCQILDVGCGSGWTTLALAVANPEAKIIAIDFSPQSIEVAKTRCAYHQVDDRVEFHCLSLEEVESLGLKFDMIHCDEVLYLVPNPFFFLQTFQKILKPDGVIRANFHSAHQRHYYYQAQDFFKEIGVFHETAGDLEIGIVKDIFNCLREDVVIKSKTIDKNRELSDELVRMNFMIQGDRGFTISQIFELLEGANLEFIRMLEWPTWRLDTLFKSYDDLPVFLAFSFNDLDAQTHLHLYDMLNPVHRLIDFWCGHPQDNPPETPRNLEWMEAHQDTLKIHLHPLLKTDRVYADLLKALLKSEAFNVSEAASIVPNPVLLPPQIATCFLPLFQAPQSLSTLVDRYLRLYPIHPLTDQPHDRREIEQFFMTALLELEQFTYVLFEDFI